MVIIIRKQVKSDIGRCCGTIVAHIKSRKQLLFCLISGNPHTKEKVWQRFFYGFSLFGKKTQEITGFLRVTNCLALSIRSVIVAISE